MNQAAPVYRVKDWDQNFEGAKSRTYNNKSTCQMPTKHGLGYRKLIRHKNGPALFGAWCALIQVLSRQPMPRQGYCTDTGRADGRPFTATDLELLTDIPQKLFSEMMQVASSKDVAWLGIPDGYHADTEGISQGGINSDSDSDLNSDSDSCSSRSGFEEFWKSYPRKVGKKAAQTAWKKAALPPIEKVLSAVSKQKQSPQWRKEGGRYIPNPATWLNQGRWDDETSECDESDPCYGAI